RATPVPRATSLPRMTFAWTLAATCTSARSSCPRAATAARSRPAVTRCRSLSSDEERRLQMAGRGHALVRLPVQLRGPAGDLLRLPDAQGSGRGRDGAGRHSAGRRRFVVHVRVRGGAAAGGDYRRPRQPQDAHPRGLDLLVAGDPGDGPGDRVLAPGPVPR